MTVVRLTVRSPRSLYTHWFSLVGASFAVHLTLILAMIFLPRVFRPRLNFPDVYTVNLVSLPSGAPGPAASTPQPKSAAPAPAPAPAPAKPKAAIKIPERPTSKAAKPKPVAKPPAKPKAEEPKPDDSSDSREDTSAAGKEASPAQAAGSAPVAGLAAGGEGVPGATGAGGAGGMLDDATFQYGWYLSNMSSIFSRNWTRPIKPDLDRTLRAVVHFRIQKDGHLTEIVLEQPSGDASLDRSALRAIQDSNPLPPLPYQYGKDSLGVRFFFDLVPD